jgi:hypothetical protein
VQPKPVKLANRWIFTWLTTSALSVLGALSSRSIAQEALSGQATELRRFTATEAHQGVATDARYFYAIANSEIGKYDKRTGHRTTGWKGDPETFIHLNSCSVLRSLLFCSLSNYPNLPMASSVEWFDTKSMTHVGSHSFGPGRGSLTWIDWHDGSWWACFANYDNRGGDPSRDHRATVLVKLNQHFVEQESWLFPSHVLDRFAHYSSSGGRWGRGGLLYVTGHDLPELYVLRLPKAGPRLEFVSTIGIPTGGQAFDWDFVHRDHIWTIARQANEVVESRLPSNPQ